MLFDGPRLKVVRAGEHLETLRAEMARDIGEFLNSRAKLKVTITQGPPARAGELPVHLILPLPTLRWGVIVGDVVHDLRSSLDNAVEELTVARRGSSLPLTGFPVFTNRARFYRRDERGEAAPRSGLYAIRGISKAAASLVEAAQPYHASGPRATELCQLHELWNIDKHRITPILLTKGPFPEFAYPAGLPGNDAVESGEVVSWDDARRAVARRDRTMVVQFRIGFEFETVFGPGPAEGEPVVPKLRSLATLTSELLDRLAAT
jgi:hypothetical protein